MTPTLPNPVAAPDLNTTNHLAKLLVSVRSKDEALSALAGGAAIIDVKEPKNGPLGRAPFDVWREVSEVVPPTVPVSVALGELSDWSSGEAGAVPTGAWSGVAFRKLGLSHARSDWSDRWRRLREQLGGCRSSDPPWVAVVYIDWQTAGAPPPESIIQAASTISECHGVLFDTWDKSLSSGIDLDLEASRRSRAGIGAVRGAGRLARRRRNNPAGSD